MRRGRTLLFAVTLLGPASGARTLAAVTAATDCAALAAVDVGDDTAITAADAVAAAGALPAYCRVRGVIDERVGAGGTTYGIRFELRLPDGWNRRFVFQGGGGTDGIVFEPLGFAQGLLGASNADGSALSRGFAVVATDAGHQGFGQEFGADAQARIDYAHRALDLVTQRSKTLIARYFGRPIKRSYLVGCSNGGRQGMLASQRFPEHFDGIVAASPAFHLAGVTVAAAWDTQAFTAIAPPDGGGAPILARALSDTDLALVADSVLDACDELDGLADGIVAAPSACRFDPATLACAGPKTPSCLATAQVNALARVFGGPHDSAGAPLYATWPWDPGIGAVGWRMWKLGTSETPIPNSSDVTVAVSILRWVFFTPPEPAFDPLAFDFDTDPARAAAGAALGDATSTDLDAFRRRRGKLLLYTGLADPVFSAHDLVAYYDRLTAAQGGLAATQRFARLFLVPGMTHCSGGPALDRFDPLTAIVRWVEKGRAPAKLVATGAAFPGRSRPLCPYPKEARYRGRGDGEAAASFRCGDPS